MGDSGTVSLLEDKVNETAGNVFDKRFAGRWSSSTDISPVLNDHEVWSKLLLGVEPGLEIEKKQVRGPLLSFRRSFTIAPFAGSCCGPFHVVAFVPLFCALDVTHVLA